VTGEEAGVMASACAGHRDAGRPPRVARGKQPLPSSQAASAGAGAPSSQPSLPSR
jgi:hypothetical protein